MMVHSEDWGIHDVFKVVVQSFVEINFKCILIFNVFKGLVIIKIIVFIKALVCTSKRMRRRRRIKKHTKVKY
jgi:hypothetical protein